MQITLTSVIAVLAFVTSVGSLVWNMAQFRIAGGRAKVLMVGGALFGGEVVPMRVGPNLDRDVDRLIELNGGRGDRIVGVTVFNRGRIPIRVQRWGLAISKGPTWWAIGFASLGNNLPAVIEPGAQQTWAVDPFHAIRLAKASDGMFGSKPPIRVVIELGSGRTIVSSDCLQVLD